MVTAFFKRSLLPAFLVFSTIEASLSAPGDLLVSGRFDNRVSLFAASSGVFLGVAAQTGLSYPVGVAIGQDGNIYVANGLTNQILRFNALTGASIETD